MAPTDRELEMLMRRLDRMEELFGKRLDAHGETLDSIVEQLAAAKGGATVLRWLGFGSLGGVIAACSAVYVWLRAH